MPAAAVEVGRRIYTSQSDDFTPLFGKMALGLDGTEFPAAAIIWDRHDPENDDRPNGDDWRTFAFFYGMAYTVARIEDPLGSQETWMAVAHPAAIEAFRRIHTVGGGV